MAHPASPVLHSKQPLAMVYDSSHFMPLVANEAPEGVEEPVLLPLCDKEYEPLQVRFRLSDEEVAGPL